MSKSYEFEGKNYVNSKVMYKLLQKRAKAFYTMKNFHHIFDRVYKRPNSIISSKRSSISKSFDRSMCRMDEDMDKVMNVRRIISKDKSRLKLAGDSYHSWIPLRINLKKV